jgi:hypothetical protein
MYSATADWTFWVLLGCHVSISPPWLPVVVVVE